MPVYRRFINFEFCRRSYDKKNPRESVPISLKENRIAHDSRHFFFFFFLDTSGEQCYEIFLIESAFLTCSWCRLLSRYNCTTYYTNRTDQKKCGKKFPLFPLRNENRKARVFQIYSMLFVKYFVLCNTRYSAQEQQYKKRYELRKRYAGNYYLKVSHIALCIEYSARKFFIYDKFFMSLAFYTI